MSIPKLEAVEHFHNEVMLRVLRVYANVTVATKPQTLPIGSPERVVYIGFCLNLSFITHSPVSVFEGFTSSGLSWHYFMLRLWKQIACSPVRSM